jgi:tRNA-dihydrouridine synthase C
MIGRAALRNPFLFQQIKMQNNETKPRASIELIPSFFEACVSYANEDYATARTKQWLNQLRVVDEKAMAIFEEVKTLKKPIEFKQKLEQLLST